MLFSMLTFNLYLLSEEYKQWYEKMSNAFHRRPDITLPTIDSGEGCYLIDQHGKYYFDAGGAAVSCLGHSDVVVKNAIKNQLDKVAFAHTSFFKSQKAEDLCKLLARHAPGNLDRVYVVSGGSEAMESAIKLARQYYIEKNKPDKHRIIARQQSYHGNTLGSLAAGGNQSRREAFLPLLIESSHISPCYEYRGKKNYESVHEYGQRVANELEAEILRIGPGNVMAFVAETVVGATLGAVPPVEGYFKRIREICDQYEVLLILDEVMCGIGRTGSLFACEQYGIIPDILTIAKGLGAGYQPIGAMICTAKIYEAISNGSGFFQHGHTYLAHPTACAAAESVISSIIARDLLNRVNLLGRTLISELNHAFGQHPNIGDIRGKGLFIGLELVKDRPNKTPFEASKQISKTIKKIAFLEGLMCYPMSGTVDGNLGDHILLAPPFIMEEHQIDEIIVKLGRTFKKVLHI